MDHVTLAATAAAIVLAVAHVVAATFSRGARDRAAQPLVDAASAAALTRAQLTAHRALCSWCTIASLATAAAAPLAIPEARAALRTLRQRM